MNQYGLRARMMVFTLAPTLVIGLLLSISFLINRHSALEERTRAWGYNLIEPLAIASEYGMTFQIQNSVREILNLLHCRHSHLIRSIAIFDAKNNLFATSNAKAYTPADLQIDNITMLLEEPTVSKTENTLIIRMPIVAGNVLTESIRQLEGKPAVLGYIAMAIDRTPMKLEQYQEICIVLLLLLVNIASAAVCGYRLTQDVIDPIHTMIETVDRIRRGQLSNRIVSHMPGELNLLKQGVNAMASSLKAYRDEMQHNIEQATSDLRETLEQMEVQNVELNLAKKRAQEASRVKSEFLANMSHELRTPLNSIIGFTRQLIKTPLSSNQLDALQTIERSGNTLLNIINDVLDFSKLEAGKLVLERIPFSLRDNLDEVIILLAPSAHIKGIQIILALDTNLPDHLIGDPMRLQQILTNLLANAVKFTKEGYIHILLSAKEVTETELVLGIKVKDTGIGIPMQQQKGLFQPFQQADSSVARRYGGTGLGLVITQRLISHMSGEIGLESQEQAGSTFWFTVRLQLPEMRSDPAIHLNLLAGQRLLYIEGDQFATESTKQLLSIEPLEVSYRAAIPSEDDERFYDLVMMSMPITEAPFDVEKVQALAARLRPLGRRLLFALPAHHLAQAIEYTDLLEIEHFLPKPLARSQFFSALCGDSIRRYVQNKVTQKTRILPLRVMAVDDNPANLKLIGVLLEDRVARAFLCTSGQEAIDTAAIEQFDLVLMDIQMPDIDGIQASDIIRTMQKHRKTPIVALTAHALKGEKEALLARGMNDYLTKPINETLLTELLTRYASRKLLEATSVAKQLVFSQGNEEESLSDTSPVDWELACRLAGSRPALARELLEMLIQSFQKIRPSIKAFLHEPTKNSEAISVIHKLHGSSCYSGVPGLQAICCKLETALRSGELVASLFDQWQALLTEFDRVEVAAARLLGPASVATAVLPESSGLASLASVEVVAE